MRNIVVSGGSGALGSAFIAGVVSGRRHRHLLPRVPGMHFYYPLGALAAYKAMWELARCPFYRSKTGHGL